MASCAADIFVVLLTTSSQDISLWIKVILFICFLLAESELK